MEQNKFETVDEAYNEVIKLRAQVKGMGKEMTETLYMLRTGATNEQLDYRVRNALAQYGVALMPHAVLEPLPPNADLRQDAGSAASNAK